MNLLLRLALLCGLVCLVQAAQASPSSSSREHTQVFLDWRAGRFSDTLFLRETFLGYEDDDVRCREFSSDPGLRRKEYKELLESRNIACRGSWCINGQFQCLSGDSQSCYNVEHIVDLRNSILNEYNKDIVGNVVMAYGRWNQQLGSMTWPQVEAEKRAVYDDVLMNTAMLNIVECGERKAFAPLPEPNQAGLSLSDKIGLFFGGLVLLSIVILLVLAWKYGKRPKPATPVDTLDPDPEEI